VGLTGEFGDEFEVGVVVKHDEVSRLGNCGNERIDERERSVLTSLGEQLLELDGAKVIAIGDGNRFERGQAADDRPVVVNAPSAEPELEHDGSAHSYSALGDEWGERRGDHRFRQAGKDAGVGEIRGSGHLLVSAPGDVGCSEVETIWVAEQSNEFESSLGVDYLEH
jgi:hypothetical protein